MLKYYQYNLLSHYRLQLMGLAILWVVLFHMTVDLSSIPLIGTMKSIGYGGVDIFLLLSGLGLYYSYQNYDRASLFYRKRILRILPTYLPVVLAMCILYWVIGNISFVSILLNVSTLSFWLNTSYIFDWYIPALLVLYLLTPVLMHSFKVRNIYAVVTGSSIVILLISALLANTPFDYLLIFTIRIPVFLIGFIMGHWIHMGRKTKRTHAISHMLMLLSGMAALGILLKKASLETLWEYGLWWYPFILITLPLCMLAAGLLHLLSHYGVSKFHILSFCGQHSLEIYLIHERLLAISHLVIQKFKLPDQNLLINILCVLLSLLLAAVLKQLLEKGSALFKKIRPIPKSMKNSFHAAE